MERHAHFAAAVSLLATLTLSNPASAAPHKGCARPLESDSIALPSDDAAHKTTPASFEWFYW